MTFPIKEYTDSTQYPERNSTNAWRWEYLRRNPKYQQFYELHKHEDVRSLDLRQFGINCLYDPMSDDAYTTMLPPAGLISLPTFDDLAVWEKVPGFTAELGLHMIFRTLTELQHRGDCLAFINRALPVKPQFEEIEAQINQRNDLDGLRLQQKRVRTGEWSAYLRILDGYAANASLDDIARVIYPDTLNEYPDYAGTRAVKAAYARAIALSKIFATKSYLTEN